MKKPFLFGLTTIIVFGSCNSPDHPKAHSEKVNEVYVSNIVLDSICPLHAILLYKKEFAWNTELSEEYQRFEQDTLYIQQLCQSLLSISLSSPIKVDVYYQIHVTNNMSPEVWHCIQNCQTLIYRAIRFSSAPYDVIVDEGVTDTVMSLFTVEKQMKKDLGVKVLSPDDWANIASGNATVHLITDTSMYPAHFTGADLESIHELGNDLIYKYPDEVKTHLGILEFRKLLTMFDNIRSTIALARAVEMSLKTDGNHAAIIIGLGHYGFFERVLTHIPACTISNLTNPGCDCTEALKNSGAKELF